MGKLLHKADVDGYSPFGLLNLFIGALPMISYGIIMWTIYEDRGVYIAVRIAIISFIILFIRNLKCKNIFKTIIFSILAELLGCVFVFFVIIMGIGGIDPEKQSGQQSSGNSNGKQWTEQYSNTKGTYYTDGQGNFRDQYGNDVYNPQGVSDYDKL